MDLNELQHLIANMYSEKDEARGVEGTFMWLMEEIGELAAALRGITKGRSRQRICRRSGMAGHDRQCRRNQSVRRRPRQIRKRLPRLQQNGVRMR